MLYRLLPLLMLWFHGLAWGATVLVQAPLVADGGEVVVSVQVPGLAPTDKVKIKPLEGELISVESAGDELLILRLRPPERYKPDTLRVELQVRGAMKLDEDLIIPLAAPARGSVELSFEPPSWTIGSAGTVKVTLKPKGAHPLPDTARSYAVRASAGKVGPLVSGGDGSFTTTWTPPAKLDAPAPALFAVTDLTAPDRVHGLAALPMLVKKGTEIAGIASGTLEPPAVLTAPMGAAVPAGSKVQVWVAVVQADGRPWAGAAPEIAGLGVGRSVGGGWYSYDAVAPAAGPFTAAVTLGTAKDSFTVPTTPAWSQIQLAADPPALASGETRFALTAKVVDPSGKAQPKLKLGVKAEGAALEGTVKDNGDGSYIARFKLSGDGATVAVWAPPKASTNPVARLVALPMRTTLPADGKTQANVAILPLDAYGIPVANVKIELTAPMGDGNVPPAVTSDATGIAWVAVRAGSRPGPVLVSANAKGVVTEVLLWQHIAGQSAPPLPALGDSGTLNALAQARGSLGLTMMAAGGSSFGVAASLTVSAEPGYTTPGASLQIAVKVLDAQGRPVPAPAPTLKTNVGAATAVRGDGAGAWTATVSLPPGVDGPLTLDASAGSAKGSVVVPTLESMGGVAALEEAPDSTKTPTGGTTPKTPRSAAANEATALTFRFAPFDMAYLYSASSSGEKGVPLGASFNKLPPLGVFGAAVHLEVWPKRGKVGLDAKAKLGAYQVAFGSGDQATRHMDILMPTMIGLRARLIPPDSPVGFTLGAWGQMTDTLVFEYTSDAHAAATPVDQLVFGARIGAGLTVDTDRLDVRIEAAETFGPRPLLTSGSLLFDLGIGSGAAILTFGADYDLQSLSLVNGEGADEDTVAVRAHQAALMFGIGASL